MTKIPSFKLIYSFLFIFVFHREEVSQETNAANKAFNFVPFHKDIIKFLILVTCVLLVCGDAPRPPPQNPQAPRYLL